MRPLVLQQFAHENDNSNWKLALIQAIANFLSTSGCEADCAQFCVTTMNWLGISIHFVVEPYLKLKNCKNWLNFFLKYDFCYLIHFITLWTMSFFPVLAASHTQYQSHLQASCALWTSYRCVNSQPSSFNNNYSCWWDTSFPNCVLTF